MGTRSNPDGRLFPSSRHQADWAEFNAEGYSRPVTGVIYRGDPRPDSGVPLGGLATGCLDLDADGRLGHSTIFSHIWGHDDRDRVFNA